MLLLLPQLPEAPLPDPAAYVRLHRAADEALSAGAPAEARRAFEGCLELSRENSAVAYGLASAEALAGNGVAALDWLERAADWGYADAAVAEWDEDLTSLRAADRFAGILDRMRGLARSRDPRRLHWIRDEVEVPAAMHAVIDSSGEIVAVGQTDGVVLVLDARSGRRLGSSPDLGSPIQALAFQPGTRQVAALTQEGRVYLWTMSPIASHAEEAREIAELPVAASGQKVACSFGYLLQFDSTGERLLVRASGRTQLLRTTGELIREWHSPASFFRPHLVWSADGGEIASWTDSRVEFRDGHTGLESRKSLEALSEVASVAYTPADP